MRWSCWVVQSQSRKGYWRRVPLSRFSLNPFPTIDFYFGISYEDIVLAPMCIFENPKAQRAWMIIAWLSLSNAFPISILMSWIGCPVCWASCIRCVARRDRSWMPLSAMKPCWCSPWLLGGWETVFWPGFLTVFCTELSAYWGAENPGKLTGSVSWDVNDSSLFDLFLKTNWLIAYVQSFDLDTLVTPSPRTP